MKSKQFHFESHDGKFYTALFSLTKVDDKEVYEFLAKEEEQKDFLHYGYMTKAMAEKLLSKRERDQEIYMKSISLKSNPKDIPQKQKIILDLPDKIDEKSFLPGGLPFQSASLTLYSKSYQEKLVPAVTIKPHSSFTFDTNESTVIFKFPNNEIECTNFMVGEFAEGSHNTIDLNVENSKAEEIIIQGVRPISSINNETYLWIKNKEREVIYVYGVLLPSNVEKKEALFNEGVSYIPISANGAIRIYHAKITNCEIGDISSINIAFSDPSLPTYTTHINNLVLAKSSHLFLRSGVAVESERIINNCLVEEGKFSVLDDGDYEISNSTLSNGEIFLNNETGLVTISNSNIQGSNGIKNITSVDCSILKDAIIYSSEPIEVRDEMVVDKKILDYSTHLAQPNQKEVSPNSIITNKIEVL